MSTYKGWFIESKDGNQLQAMAGYAPLFLASRKTARAFMKKRMPDDAGWRAVPGTITTRSGGKKR